MYNLQLAITLPKSEQTLAITINKVNLNKKDIKLLPTIKDIAISVPILIQTEAELSPQKLPLIPQISPK